MWKRSIFSVWPVVVLSLVQGSAAYGAYNPLQDPALIGWWPFDEGSGTVARDSSPNGNDGTVNGGATWVAGVHGMALNFNGSDAYVGTGKSLLNNLPDFTLAGWLLARNATTNRTGVFGQNDLVEMGFNSGGCRVYTPGGALTVTWNFPATEWHHVAVIDAGTTLSIYLDGQVAGTSTVAASRGSTAYPFNIGGGGIWDATGNWLNGQIDDVALFSRALTPDEIKMIMKGLLAPGAAGKPVPADKAADVLRDTPLGWTPGPYAATHDVYVGTTFADVNTASRIDKKGVLASQGQADVVFDPPGTLAYGQTYYWRVDEVNKAPDNTIFKGAIWSFTVESYGYPVKPVKATASSYQTDMGPENTVNGSGLTGDQHGTEPTTMWLSAGAQPNWIQYEFDKAYKLHQLMVWNSNQLIESFLGFGARKVTIKTSLDGTTWTPLANVPEFGRGPGAPAYAANTTVNFGGLEARFVKLTINNTWGGVGSVTGLAEVRFSYVPVQARAPQPAAAVTGVSIDADLTWRPGREAAAHSVSFGTDPNALGAAKKVTDHSFDPGSLDFGTTYYWKVEEVNTVTYPGDLWSFTTQEFAALDDFESYTDKQGAEIFTAWVDGMTNSNGSIVGLYPDSVNGTFCETTIVHGGKQSMPFEYNNVKPPYYSEATRTFDQTQDWTGNGANTLSLWVRGRPVDFVDKGNGAFTIGASGHDIWNNADDFRYVYEKLSGDGSIMVKVDSLVNTHASAKAGVMIRQDLTDGSPMVDMILTATNGVGMEWRPTAGANAVATNASKVTTIRAPQWVKLTRKGNDFTAQYSADGKTWLDIKNPALTGTVASVTVNMPSNVYLGLCVTSHTVTDTTVAEFSGVATTGNVTGAWQQAWIGDDLDRTNDPAGLYVVVEDKVGKKKTIVNPDAAAVNKSAWTQWRIPFSDLAGVNLAAVKKLTIGVGAGKAGGAGKLYIDDIGFGKPAQ